MKKRFKANKSNRVMMQCTTVVDRDAVQRQNIDGVEHIVISSFTLPDNIVMNGGLYPAEEIDKSFESLERTLAPVEHPTDSSGNFISANDPFAIHNFHAGAFNTNVTKEGNRIKIDKFVNVQEALKTERGKRLLDRVTELETNEKARPIHTSVGVFLLVEETDGPQTNAEGQEFTWIAREMVFDHDAILLDSVGAAQPDQGVGMAVNAEGQECDVHYHAINSGGDETVTFDRLAVLFDNEHDVSFDDIRQSVHDALEQSAFNVDWIEELFDDRVIFWSKDQLFDVPYVIDSEGIATIVGIPVPVERDVTFTPKVNQKGEAMKEVIVNALKAASIEIEGLDDDQLLAAYNALQAKAPDGDDGSDDADDGQAAAIAQAVTNAIKPLTEEVAGLKVQINADSETELNSLAELVGNSDKYPGIDTDAAKLLGIETLKGMAATCQPSYGIPGVVPVNNSDKHSVKTDMPE